MRKQHYILLLPVLLAFGVYSCKREAPLPVKSSFLATPVKPSDVFPASFGMPLIPKDNPLTEEGIYLGRMLFYDPVLSLDSSISCASCHRQEFAFGDPKTLSKGVFGLQGTRNAPPLYNLAWQRTFFWDARQRRLRDLVFEPIQDHREMAMNVIRLEEKLRKLDRYQIAFRKAFGEEPNLHHMSLAMEQFLMTIVSANSKFDQFFPRNLNAFSPQERDGFLLFNGTPDSTTRPAIGADCFHCHGGVHAQAIDPSIGIVSNGLDDVLTDKGYGNITGKASDLGKFKSPSLRNLVYTAPYMHDGRFTTLEQVIDHYSDNLKFNAPNLSPQLNHGNLHLQLTAAQKSALIAFLKTMTDSSLLTNKAYSNPFR
jgi:cytochrome c peroxidase